MSAENRLERFIGVIYRPDTERISHYSQSVFHEQFDAYVWFDCTESVKPLEVFQPDTPLGNGETYPFGLSHSTSFLFSLKKVLIEPQG